MQSLWSIAHFYCWPIFIQNTMGENYFNFVFSTAVVKSAVDPADGHSSAEAGLPLLRVPSSGQQWLLCSWLPSSQTQIDLPGSWPWISLSRRLGTCTSSSSQFSNPLVSPVSTSWNFLWLVNNYVIYKISCHWFPIWQL